MDSFNINKLGESIWARFPDTGHLTPDTQPLLQTELIMTTHFITAEIDLQASPAETQRAIEAELQKRGEPLRWAITEVNEATQKAIVEGIVTVPAVQVEQ